MWSKSGFTCSRRTWMKWNTTKEERKLSLSGEILYISSIHTATLHRKKRVFHQHFDKSSEVIESAKTGLPLWMLGLGADLLWADMNRLLAFLFHQVPLSTFHYSFLLLTHECSDSYMCSNGKTCIINACSFVLLWPGSVGWTILAASAAAGWDLPKLCIRGCQHLFPWIRKASHQSQIFAVINLLLFLYFSSLVSFISSQLYYYTSVLCYYGTIY